MCKRGDVYYITLPKGEGSEQGGTRPAVIIQNNVGNTYSPTVIVATITSAGKKYMPTHLDIMLEKPSKILCEQIMTISKDRLQEKVGVLTEDILKKLDIKLKLSLGLS
jgi:mRNA interferase MazF